MFFGCLACVHEWGLLLSHQYHFLTFPALTCRRCGDQGFQRSRPIAHWVISRPMWVSYLPLCSTILHSTFIVSNGSRNNSSPSSGRRQTSARLLRPAYRRVACRPASNCCCNCSLPILCLMSVSQPLALLLSFPLVLTPSESRCYQDHHHCYSILISVATSHALRSRCTMRILHTERTHPGLIQLSRCFAVQDSQIASVLQGQHEFRLFSHQSTCQLGAFIFFTIWWAFFPHRVAKTIAEVWF